MASGNKKRKFGELAADAVLYAVLTVFGLVTLYPLVYIALASLSSAKQVMSSGAILIWPDKLHFDAYAHVFSSPNIMIGYRNTLFYVAIGTTISVVLTLLAGYVLSRKWLFGKNVLMTFVMIPMFFSGGMIPTYLLIRGMGLLDTVWSVLLPGVIAVYNVIITRTFISAIPSSLEEAAKIDGANDSIILFKIFVPLSLPIIAVNILYYAVARWNAWFEAMMYIRTRTLYPLQMFLREVLVQNEMNEMGGVSSELAQNVKYATIIVSILPILAVYPFLQKYFVQGVMIGAVKE